MRPSRGHADVSEDQAGGLAGQRHAHRERRRPDPPDRRPGTRGSLDLGWLVSVRRDRRAVPAHEVLDPISRDPRLQPIERRARRSLPGAGQRGDRAARLLVGAARLLDAHRLRRHPGRRRTDHLPAPTAHPRRHFLADARRWSGSPCCLGTLHDRGMGPRASVRDPLLVGDRRLTRGARLPLLHDHRPQDHPGGTGGADRVRRLPRCDLHAADGTSDDGVRGQGWTACRPRRHDTPPLPPRPCLQVRRGSNRWRRPRRPDLRVPSFRARSLAHSSL